MTTRRQRRTGGGLIYTFVCLCAAFGPWPPAGGDARGPAVPTAAMAQSRGAPDSTTPAVRKRPLRLWPPATQPALPEGASVRIGEWSYRAHRTDARDAVPWELVATPVEEQADRWQLGVAGQPMPPMEMARKQRGDIRAKPAPAPQRPGTVIEVPDVLWKQWFARDMSDVVGIHFHEVVAEDKARILFTLHKAPPDGPDGTPPADYNGVHGSRIEATLLAPLTFHLDQTIVVRVDPLKKELVDSRAAHELAHAALSQDVFLAVLQGPADWNLPACTGRRTKLAYYWRREEIGRAWRELRGGRERVKALRTTVVLVPPTRWSLMLPIPPERVTQQHVDDFNEAITRVSQRFVEVDTVAQERFHGQHGAFEAAGGP